MNLSLKGKFIYYNGETIVDLLLHVYYKHGHRVTPLTVVSLDTPLRDYPRKALLLRSNMSDALCYRGPYPADVSAYKSILIEINSTYGGNSLFNVQPQRKLEIMLTKIVKDYGKYKLLKFGERRQINWGSGPTLPSIYHIATPCDKEKEKTGRLIPICEYIEQFEIMIEKFDVRFDNFLGETSYPYSEIKLDDCPICLDNPANTYLGCTGYHCGCCESCAPKITNCPLCREHSNSRTIVNNK
jgi:hypothetical protein